MSNLELGTLALPIMLFLFTKSLKQSLTDRIIGPQEDVAKKIFLSTTYNNLTSKEISQTMKVILYEIEVGRLTFCNKFNGKKLTQNDWSKIKTNCINGSLNYVLPIQLMPIWSKCSADLDKFCFNIDWVQMKGCIIENLIESVFEHKIYFIQLWYKDRMIGVLDNLAKMKLCITQTGGQVMNKRNQFLSIKSN